MNVITAGIDIGSLTAKAVILRGDPGHMWKVLSMVVIPTGVNAAEAGRKVFNRAIAKAKVPREAIDNIVATGYGRAKVPFEATRITEISCHARGAVDRIPGAKTVIDIGGQDSKVIRVSASGKVMDFVMNDKCAAGTGRFLEVMAKALELELEDLGHIDTEARKARIPAVAISSTCTVFAESEVISHIAEGASREAMILGLHSSVAERIAAMVNRVGLEPPVVMTGGVAKNSGVVHAIEEKIGSKITLPRSPQIIGALGAAILALEK